MRDTDIRIRPARAGDVPGSRHVNEQAFAGPAEARLVEALRDHDGVVLSLVAVRGERIVGHVLFSPAEIVAPGASVPAVALAPVAVLPTDQRQGIGARLIRRGLEALRSAGHEIVIVLGHPRYYPRFGFAPASRFGVACPYDGVADEAFMALGLRPGALQGRSGTVRYRPEFADL